MNDKPKPFPCFKSDKEAEQFVEKADLAEYDFSDFNPMDFDFAPSKEPPKKPSKT